jgi:hypothetical protein
MSQHEPRFAVHPTVTPTEVMTAGEKVATACHDLWLLMDTHSLPAPAELYVRFWGAVRINGRLGDLHDLKRWAEATDAAVAGDGWVDGKWQYVACTVLGDVPLRLTCFGEALTP